MIRKNSSLLLDWFICALPLAIAPSAAAYAGSQFSKLYSVPLPPLFLKPGGLYPSPFSITLTSEANTIIYYTLDGTVPTEKSNVYSGTKNFIPEL